MKKYAIIQPKAYVVLALAILMLAIGANLVFAHTSSVGLMSPSLIVYAGEDGWSQTISVSITGGLLIPEECQDCYICVNVGGLSFTESLSDQNAYTRTLHKSDMGDVLPGVYPVSWYIHWEDANTETLFSTDVLFNPFSGYPICLRPVSVNKADKKVTYSTNINTGRYTGIYDELEHTPLTSLCYSAYAPDLTPVPSSTVITVPSGEDSFLSNLIVEYTKTDRDHAGYQIWLAAECAYAMRTRPPVWMFSQRVGDFYSNTERNITYSAACTTCVTETPHFYLTKVMTSTTTNPETSPYQNAIEPVYSDSVTYRWQRTYNEFHAKAIALYQEYDNDAEGRFKFGDKYYEEILHSSVDINDSQITSDIDLGAQTQKLTAEGEVTWTAKDASENTVTIFPAGHHRVGIKYSDADGDNVELASDPHGWGDYYVDVDLSVYDVYTEKSLYVTDPDDGEIVVNYTLSSEAKKSSTNTDTDPAHKVKINIGTQGTVYGPGNAGSNVSNPWDGAIGDGEYVEGGTDGVVLDLAPAVYAEGQSANIGAFLSIGTITKSTESFIPESNETVSVSFVLSEPVRRPQATTANITSYIYDSDGRFVRLLLNEASAVDSGEVNINNQTEGHNDGANTFIWDGKDERGNIVEDGTYTITIFAKDNAGVGCESPCMTTTVDVASPEVPDPTKCEISWPEYPWPIEGQTPPAGVPGVTDSNATVYVKIGMSEEYALTPDSENGAFYVVMPETPGRYSVRLRSTGAFPEENIITVPYIVNQPSITSIADDDTIDPQGTGNVDITYNSEYGDANEKVDVSVVAAYDQSQTADSPNPVPSADKMNGGITAALTRNLSGQDGFSVATGANTYTWDRHDNNGQDLKPGLYDIIVKRRNTDGAGDMEAVVKVRVANPTGGPSISNISSHVDGPTANITWNATAASNCYVTYEVDGNPAGKLKALSTGSGSCVAWIPGAMPQTEYSYHILAVNPTTNASTISTKQTLTTRYGVQIGTSRATVKSVTETEAEVDIEYSAADFVTAAVEYAQVGPGITIQWNRAEHAYKDQEHVFKLTGLEPNSEYVYRMVSSEDKTWANSTKSEFKSFMTKIDGPSVSFVDLENGQGVSSLSTVTVRASDAHHRFSAHGITNVELYLDGEQVTVQPTKTTEASSVDYTFDMSGLNLYNGVHSVVAKAEDDFWQTSNARIDVLLYTEGAGSSTMQATALHTTTTMTAQSNQGGAGSQAVAKKYRCAACVKPGLQLVYREGKLPPGHAFLKFTHPATYISKWIGFATDSAKRFSLIFESKGYVRDEKKWEPNFIYNMYNLNDIKVTELQSLWTIILRDRANPPVFSTVPNPPGSHNCVTWIQRVIFKSGIANYDRDQFGQQAYFTMPDEMEELAEELNFEREDKIGWNRP